MNSLLEPDGDAARREEQFDQRLRALGTHTPQCSVGGCDESDPFALTGADPKVVCREHVAELGGRRRVEDHHVAARGNDPMTVPLLANDHGAASAHQEIWAEETLRNSQRSPLRRAAAWLRGWLDVLRLIIDRHVGRIPAALEQLDARLMGSIGPEWWETLGWSW